MSKSILYRLFGLGKIPKDVVPIVEKEGILFKEEGIGGSATLRNFRKPGTRYGYKSTWFIGSIVLTNEHFLAFQWSTPVVGLAWKAEEMAELYCYLDDKKKFHVDFDAAKFNDAWSGDIEVKFSTEHGQEIIDIIREKTE